MRKLLIEKTSKTPRVLFDPDNWVLEIEGISRPENVRQFYYPIIERLENFRKNELESIKPEERKKPFIVKLYLDYFNSSSAKFILDIIMQIAGFHDDGMNPIIEWYFEEDDIDTKEAGQEFEELVDIEFKYIMVKDN